MRIALTGAAGFVGSTIARHLLLQRHSVLAIDNLSTGKIENVPPGCDWNAKDAAEADYSACDAIVHAAAYPDVSQNWVNPDERTRQWMSNADLTRRVLDRAPKDCIFVLLSTCSVYGGGTVDERSVLRSTSPYAASKIAAEALVQAYTEAGRVHGRILRLVNVVGPRYSHGHVADFVRQVRATGEIRALDDGWKRKSFVHADDVARAVQFVVEARRAERVINVSSPCVWSWRDTAAVMQAMSKRHIPIQHDDKPSGWIGDPDELVVGSALGPLFYRGSIVNGVWQALAGLGWPG
jgi:UDP-glucose 4-epimerase